jgi:hypothetical protein
MEEMDHPEKAGVYREVLRDRETANQKVRDDILKHNTKMEAGLHDYLQEDDEEMDHPEKAGVYREVLRDRETANQKVRDDILKHNTKMEAGLHDYLQTDFDIIKQRDAELKASKAADNAAEVAALRAKEASYKAAADKLEKFGSLSQIEGDGDLLKTRAAELAAADASA